MPSVVSKSSTIKWRECIKKTKYLEEKALDGRTGDKERTGCPLCWCYLSDKPSLPEQVVKPRRGLL